MTSTSRPRLVDLSHPLDDGTPVLPGDPAVRLRPAATLARDGCNVLHLSLGSHSGTHVDAPFHVVPDGVRVDALPLELCPGPAVVADVRGAGDRGRIGWAALAPHVAQLGAARILVLRTGWSEHWGTERYLAHPFLTGGAAQRLVAAGVRAVGIDALSVDETFEPGAPAAGLPAHEALLGAGGVIVENLTGLEALEGEADVVLWVLPLRLTGADGSPVRAVASLPARA
jgi:kynurenine formamidase